MLTLPVFKVKRPFHFLSVPLLHSREPLAWTSTTPLEWHTPFWTFYRKNARAPCNERDRDRFCEVYMIPFAPWTSRTLHMTFKEQKAPGFCDDPERETSFFVAREANYFFLQKKGLRQNIKRGKREWSCREREREREREGFVAFTKGQAPRGHKSVH